MTTSEHIRGLLPGLFSALKPLVNHGHNRKTAIFNELLESTQAYVLTWLVKDWFIRRYAIESMTLLQAAGYPHSTPPSYPNTLKGTRGQGRGRDNSVPVASCRESAS